MSEQLLVKYYGRGFSKGKNGGQKAMSGVVIAKGEPTKSWLIAGDMLDSMGYHVFEEPLLEHLTKREIKRFKEKL